MFVTIDRSAEPGMAMNKCSCLGGNLPAFIQKKRCASNSGGIQIQIRHGVAFDITLVFLFLDRADIH